MADSWRDSTKYFVKHLTFLKKKLYLIKIINVSMSIGDFNSLDLNSKVDYLWSNGEVGFSKIVSLGSKYAVMVFKVDDFHATLIHNRDSKEYVNCEGMIGVPKTLTVEDQNIQVETWDS